jgi:pimeloyl-ACP methyl ester carboxylesterase
MKIAEFEGAKVAYRVDGSGPGLVLVHGTGGDSLTNWGHLVEYLSPHWTVVRPDYSGSGDTKDNGGPLTAAVLAAQVVAAAQAAGTVPFDLVGFSLGAAVAAFIAAEYPTLVRSVVLLAGFASGEDSRQKMQFELWRNLIRSDRRSMARLVLLTGFSPDFVSGLGDAAVEHRGDRQRQQLGRHGPPGRIGPDDGRARSSPKDQKAGIGDRLHA